MRPDFGQSTNYAIFRKPHSSSQSGFTLVEIAFAVAILALALTTIVAIQSNVTTVTIADRNRFQAALFAQYLLTVSDLQDQKPEPGSKSGNLADALREAGWSEEDGAASLAPYAGWTTETNVQSMSILEVADALRRIDLTVSWAADQASQFRVTYFISGVPKPEL